MYTLNIGDLPVNAEVPALKPIRVIRPIPNGKYLEHTIINVKTEGDKIIVDIPQIQLCHISKYRADARRLARCRYDYNPGMNYLISNIDDENKSFHQLKYAVCIDLFQSGAARSRQHDVLYHKNISRKPDGNHHTKIRAYGWTPILMQELDLNRSRYEFPLSKIKWRNMLTLCQKYEISKLVNKFLGRFQDLDAKLNNGYYIYARAAIRSIRKYDYDTSVSDSETYYNGKKSGTNLQINNFWPNVKKSSFLKPENIKIRRGSFRSRSKIRTVYTSCPWLDGYSYEDDRNLFRNNKKRPHHIKQEWLDKNKVIKLIINNITRF